MTDKIAERMAWEAWVAKGCPKSRIVAQCTDPRHETPCPHFADKACVACQIECDPTCLQLAPPELVVVPPCRKCGKVPVTYCRFGNEVEHLTGECEQ